MLVGEDVDLIQSTLRAMPERKNLNVVDIGAGSGTTSLSALQAGPSVTVYSMDVSVADLHWAQVVVSNVGRLNDWNGCIGWDELIATVGRKKIHMVMVDYEPTSEAVAYALARVFPWLGKDARVWVHNYGEPYLGVVEAVAGAIEEGYYRLAVEAGLGVVLSPV